MASSINLSSISQPNSKLEDIGVDYVSTPQNYLFTLVFLLIISAVHLVIVIIFKKRGIYCQIIAHRINSTSDPEYKSSRCLRMNSTVWSFFHANFYVTTFTECFLFLIISCLNEMVHFPKANIFDWISSTITICILLTLVAATIAIIIFLLLSDPQKQAKNIFRSLYSGIRIHRKLTTTYHAIFLTRRTMLA